MSKKQKSKDTKEVAIKYYLEKNISQDEIANIFGISRQTFIKWLRRYYDNNLHRKKRVTSSYINYIKYAYSKKK